MDSKQWKLCKNYNFFFNFSFNHKHLLLHCILYLEKKITSNNNMREAFFRLAFPIYCSWTSLHTNVAQFNTILPLNKPLEIWFQVIKKKGVYCCQKLGLYLDDAVLVPIFFLLNNRIPKRGTKQNEYFIMQNHWIKFSLGLTTFQVVI